jgi:hypothetical protein
MFLRIIALKLWLWFEDLTERYVRVPRLIRQGTIHRKLKARDGGFQYIIRFPDRMVRVRPEEAGVLEASCLRRTLAGGSQNDRYKAAAIAIVRRQPEF